MKKHVFDFLFISIYINIVNRDRFKCTYSVFHVWLCNTIILTTYFIYEKITELQIIA